MIDNNYIKEAIMDVMAVVDGEGIYKSIIDLENPKDMYIFMKDNSFVKVDYLYKVSRVGEKTLYMSLLSFEDMYPNFLRDNGVRLDFAEAEFNMSDFGYVENKELKKIFDDIELDYYENLI